MLIYQTDSPDKAYGAFNELYLRYSLKAYNFLKSKVKNVADSEDLLQRVFIKIHESKHLYKSQFKFEQWLFVIARTQVLDYFRANKRLGQKINSFTPEIQEAVDSDLSLSHVLSPEEIELLQMKYIDELSYQEISKIVSKSEVSLRKALSRMVMRLKNGEAV